MVEIWAVMTVRESMTGRDDVQSQPFPSMGRADVENVMTDPCMEEDARILSSACYFTSYDVEGPEEGIMPLLGSASNFKCFENLEDVGSSCILVRPWSNPQSATQFLASDYLEDREALAEDYVPFPKMNRGTCAAMDMSRDGGASSICQSDSEQASMAQVESGAHRRQRLKKNQKFVSGWAYSKSDIPPPHKLRKCRHICCK